MKFLLLLSLVFLGCAKAELIIDVDEDKAFKFEEQYLDLSFALCEGIGGAATGEISVRGNGVKNKNRFIIKDLTITGRYGYSFNWSGSITYISPEGESKKLVLSKPWYDSLPLSNDKLKYLTLKVDKSSNNINNIKKLPISIDSSGKLKMTVGIVFDSGNSSCPTTYNNEIDVKRLIEN